jgi:hypothetical protein
VLGALAAAFVVTRPEDEPAAVTLEPVGFVGEDPFATAVTVHEVAAFPSEVHQVIAATSATAPAATEPAATAAGTKTAIGTSVGLYGGTQNQAACDAVELTTFLATNPDKAAAWAGVEGITSNAIGAFVAKLTPLVLTTDTWVTNHGFTNGVANPLQSVLQAGTAVLVDTLGVPRVKCGCGNPLSAPEPHGTDFTHTRGTAWAGYTPAATVTVQAGAPVTSFRVIDVTNGKIYTAPVGSTPGPTTPPTTSATVPALPSLRDGTYAVTGTAQCDHTGARDLAGSTITVVGGVPTVRMAHLAMTPYENTRGRPSPGIFDFNRSAPNLVLYGRITDGGATIAGQNGGSTSTTEACKLTWNARWIGADAGGGTIPPSTAPAGTTAATPPTTT